MSALDWSSPTWMSERGCMLSIPPAYSKFIGEQILAQLTEVAA